MFFLIFRNMSITVSRVSGEANSILSLEQYLASIGAVAELTVNLPIPPRVAKHACCECGIVTDMPGAYCLVCADELSADGEFVGLR